MKTANEVKQEAIDRVAQGKEDYIEKAVRAGLKHLRQNSKISSAIIKDLAPVPEGMEPRVLGAVLRRLIKEADLRLLGYQTTSHRRSHCRPIAIWEKKWRK